MNNKQLIEERKKKLMLIPYVIGILSFGILMLVLADYASGFLGLILAFFGISAIGICFFEIILPWYREITGAETRDKLKELIDKYGEDEVRNILDAIQEAKEKHIDVKDKMRNMIEKKG